MVGLAGPLCGGAAHPSSRVLHDGRSVYDLTPSGSSGSHSTHGIVGNVHGNAELEADGCEKTHRFLPSNGNATTPIRSGALATRYSTKSRYEVTLRPVGPRRFGWSAE